MRKQGWWLALTLIGLLGLMAAKSLLIEPPAVRERSHADEFNAARAKARLAFILGDERPHPADSLADDQVRNRLVAELQALGLRPIVRNQLACNQLYKLRGVSCARVRNVIAAIGPARGKAVLLNCHYDSVPVGPGAADDGIGVATLLEVAAILKEQSLKRRVILLFNEGEELGLVGARAFLEDPLSDDVDTLVNLEARGVSGPVNMFETSRPNGAPVALFAAAVKRPFANSLSTDVYRLLPNYTDVNSFSERGWLTLNLAPMGNETRYHSPGDSVAALNLSTLQQMGDQTLALTRALANDPLQEGGDRIFMDVAGRVMITLPLALGVVLLLALLISFGGLWVRRGQLVQGAIVMVGTLVGSALTAWVAVELIGALRDGMFWRGYPLWTHLAIYASTMLVALALLRTVGQRLNVSQLRASFWLLYLFMGALIGLLAPGGIIFFLFPPLLALVGAFARRWWKPAETIGAILAILLLCVSWGEMIALLEEVLNQGPMWVFAPLGSLIILPVLIEAKPLIEETRMRDALAMGAALAILGWTAAAAAPAYSADRQQRFVIEHVTNAATGKSVWSVINDGARLGSAYDREGPWRRGALPFNIVPFSSGKSWLASASATSTLQAPDLMPLSSIENGNERTLILRFNANGNDRVVLIAPEDARIRSAGLADAVRPINGSESGKYVIACFGRSCDGLVLELVIGKTTPIDWLVVGSRAGLPPDGARLVAGRPKFARAQYYRDESIVFVRRRI